MRRANIIDYGSGNVGSLLKTLQHLGLQTTVSSERNDVLNSFVSFLPGVGHARHALQELKSNGLDELLKGRHDSGQPIIGICLGAQLFLDYVAESDSKGFGFVSGSTASLQGPLGYNNGWLGLDMDELGLMQLAEGLEPGTTFYFNHRYFVPAETLERRASVAGQPNTTGIFFSGLTAGIQFHPEKSQRAGEVILRNVMKAVDAL
jgi:glutamine amidotransferase